jgi:triose/dihydroxyacetone kinase / FAD-AMP lyase (cyclizing)
MKPYFFNSADIVSQAIDGYLALSSGTLARVDGHSNIVIRSDYQNMEESVAIIAIGGAGHEPAHASFVGRGMLCAAVCGDIFASPSIDAILTVILLVTDEQRSALIVVKNYGGDRVNAGEAIKKAKSYGRNVEILLVADDVSIDNPAKRRGVAGVILLEKIVGHFAQQGHLLEEIKHKCEQATSDLISLSITLSGADSLSESTAQYEPQIGRGIHNEAGKTFTFRTKNLAKEAVEEVTNRLALMIDNNRQYAILINNLGTLTHLEMGIITQEILNSKLKDCIQLVVGPAPFVTSLNSKGFSISLLPLDNEIKEALLSPVAPRAWVPPVAPVAPKRIDISLIDLHPNYPSSRNEKHLSIIKQVCEVLVSSEDTLNELDTHGSDGDCGSTLSTIASHINNKVNVLPLDNKAHLLQAIGHLISSVGGGTSGALLSLLFTHAGIALETKNLNFAAALKEGAEAMMRITGSKVGDRTMLDALLPALDAMDKRESLQVVAQVARTGANLTSTMVAKIGRTANCDSKVYLGYNDSGAEAIALTFERLANQ